MRIRVKTRVDFNKRQIEEIVSEWLFEKKIMKKIMNDDDSIGHSWACDISETLSLLTINITKKLDGDDSCEEPGLPDPEPPTPTKERDYQNLHEK